MPSPPINNEQKIATNPIARRISVLPRLLACQSARGDLDDEFANLDSYRDTMNTNRGLSGPSPAIWCDRSRAALTQFWSVSAHTGAQSLPADAGTPQCK